MYYRKFARPPLNEQFNAEWGLTHPLGHYPHTNWVEVSFEQVESYVFSQSGDPDQKSITDASTRALATFQSMKGRLHSLLSIMSEKHPSDDILKELLKETGDLYVASESEIIEQLTPKHQFMTRDMKAVSQGSMTAPHLKLWAWAEFRRLPFASLQNLADIAERATDHLTTAEAVGRTSTASEGAEKRVFIGHGRSVLWKDLREFLQTRLGLEYEEFNIDRLAAAQFVPH